jgi:hypothetical protein
MSVEDDSDMTREEGIETVYDGPSHVVILGAGASIASTIHNPEPSGKKLPSMDNFIDVVGLKEILDSEDTDCHTGNFEEIYSCLFIKDPNSRTIQEVAQRVSDYFRDLRLPDTPTIYDYLLLSLRPKDMIATFNWDPFLFQAFVRNRRFTDALPRLSFLHGNVAVGYSAKDQRTGPVGMRSKASGDEFVQTPLLYPVAHKDYNQSEFIMHEWERLKVWLEGAKRLTIFGYGAPVTDVEAVDLMGGAWGDSRNRNMEQIEIIDIQPKEVVADRWQRFIHTHHYECFNGYFQSSLAVFPRRTGERFMHQFVPVTPGEVFQEPNPVPQRFDTLEALWEWHKPLLEAENRKSASMRRDSPLDETEIKRLGSYGAGILTMFHEEYAKNPTSRETEFRRGHVSEWRHLLDFIYGAHVTEQIVDAARAESGYTIPHAGLMTEDGKGYYGFDSGADNYIGKIPS